MVARIKVIDESINEGIAAGKGDCVKFSARFFLNKGDEVTRDFKSIEMYGDQLPLREIDGIRLIEHTTILGKRQSIAGVEVALTGLTPGSYREVVIPPHLAYGDRGQGVIPPGAVLKAKVWLHEISSHKSH